MGTRHRTVIGEDRSEVSTVSLNPPPGRQPVKARLEFGALTHVGKVRVNNEDQYLVAQLGKSMNVLHSSLPASEEPLLSDLVSYLLLVADGMGGAAGGERASALVVEAAKKHILCTAKWFFRLDDPDEQVRLRLLRDSLEQIDRKLVEEAEQNPALAGMGTTLTAASCIADEVFLVHVGDSRAYLLHEGQLEQLTRDHTVAQKLVDEGLLRPEQAKSSRLRHMLTNVIGGMKGVSAEILKLRVDDGDRLLLCTDGLHDAVSDEQIAEVLQANLRPTDACQALINAALDGGGRDNITVVLAVYSIQKDEKEACHA
jgi:protein phosphatase